MTSMIFVREYQKSDDLPLQELHTQSNMGGNLIVSLKNIPNFSSRSHKYQNSVTYVILKNTQIVGSGSVAIKEKIVNCKPVNCAYLYQCFIDKQQRGKKNGNLMSVLMQHIENKLLQDNIALIYAYVLEDNIPMIKKLKSFEFKTRARILLRYLPIYKQYTLKNNNLNVNIATDEDIKEIIKNESARNLNLTPSELDKHFKNNFLWTSGFSKNNFLVCKKNNKLIAYLTYWEWHEELEVKVLSYPLKDRIISRILNFLASYFTVPQYPVTNKLIRQVLVSNLYFTNQEGMQYLLQYLNNLMLTKNVRQLCIVDKKNTGIFNFMRSLFQVDVKEKMLVKNLNNTHSMNNIYIDMFDI